MFLTLTRPVPATEQILFSRPGPCSASLADRFSLELFPFCLVDLVIAVDFCIHTPGSLMPLPWKAGGGEEGMTEGKRGGGCQSLEGDLTPVTHGTYFSKQCAAVNTHSGDIKVPPQKCCPVSLEGKRELPVKPDVLFHSIAQKIRKTSSFPEEGAASPCTEQSGHCTI